MKKLLYMNKRVVLILRIVIAVILAQTLRFKFTAHPDSVYIFSKIGLEPLGRIGIGIGILELIAAVLILIPKTIWMGALLSTGLMAGAILYYLTKLGLEINGDHGLLFYTALLTFLLSIILMFNQRKNIPIVGNLI